MHHITVLRRNPKSEARSNWNAETPSCNASLAISPLSQRYRPIHLENSTLGKSTVDTLVLGLHRSSVGDFLKMSETI